MFFPLCTEMLITLSLQSRKAIGLIEDSCYRTCKSIWSSISPASARSEDSATREDTEGEKTRHRTKIHSQGCCCKSGHVWSQKESAKFLHQNLILLRFSQINGHYITKVILKINGEKVRLLHMAAVVTTQFKSRVLDKGPSATLRNTASKMLGIVPKHQ